MPPGIIVDETPSSSMAASDASWKRLVNPDRASRDKDRSPNATRNSDEEAASDEQRRRRILEGKQTSEDGRKMAEQLQAQRQHAAQLARQRLEEAEKKQREAERDARRAAAAAEKAAERARAIKAKDFPGGDNDPNIPDQADRDALDERFATLQVGKPGIAGLLCSGKDDDGNTVYKPITQWEAQLAFIAGGATLSSGAQGWTKICKVRGELVIIKEHRAMTQFGFGSAAGAARYENYMHRLVWANLADAVTSKIPLVNAPCSPERVLSVPACMDWSDANPDPAYSVQSIVGDQDPYTGIPAEFRHLLNRFGYDLKLPREGVEKLITDLASIIGCMNRVGIFHTDLHTGNIMVIPHKYLFSDNATLRAEAGKDPVRFRIIDWGLAEEHSLDPTAPADNRVCSYRTYPNDARHVGAWTISRKEHFKERELRGGAVMVRYHPSGRGGHEGKCTAEFNAVLRDLHRFFDTAQYADIVRDDINKWYLDAYRGKYADGAGSNWEAD